MLANANAGGENVSRGMLVGALLGATHGASRIPEKLKKGLVGSAAISREINSFAVAVRRSVHPNRKSIKPQSGQKLEGEAPAAQASLATEVSSAALSPATHDNLLGPTFILPPLPSETDGVPQPQSAACVALLKSTT